MRYAGAKGGGEDDQGNGKRQLPQEIEICRRRTSATSAAEEVIGHGTPEGMADIRKGDPNVRKL